MLSNETGVSQSGGPYQNALTSVPCNNTSSDEMDYSISSSKSSYIHFNGFCISLLQVMTVTTQEKKNPYFPLCNSSDNFQAHSLPLLCLHS